MKSPPVGRYVHQMVLLEELEHAGCQVEFLERPMSHDPHDQLVLQIRSAVAEYERTLIAERMRRGRQMKLRAGLLLPWATTPYGYRGFYVDQDQYRHYFREGFERGYQDGYNGRDEHGRRIDGTLKVLAAVLAGILVFQALD